MKWYLTKWGIWWAFLDVSLLWWWQLNGRWEHFSQEGIQEIYLESWKYVFSDYKLQLVVLLMVCTRLCYVFTRQCFSNHGLIHVPWSWLLASFWARVWFQMNLQCVNGTYLYRIDHFIGQFVYLPKLSCFRCESHTCGLKTSTSRQLRLMGQIIMPDWKMWVVAALLDTISKYMLTNLRIENYV